MKKNLLSVFAILLPTNQSDLLLTKVNEILEYTPILLMEVSITIIIFIITSVILSNNIINCFIKCYHKRNRLTTIIATFCGMIGCYVFLKIKFTWLQRKIKLIIPMLPIKLSKSIGTRLLKCFFVIFALILLCRIGFATESKKR